jgi:integrase
MFERRAVRRSSLRLEHREMTTLTIDEVVRLERQAKGTELEVPLLIAIDSGLRRGELLALRWSDVELDSRRIVIRRSLEVTQEHGLRMKEPKSGKVPRVCFHDLRHTSATLLLSQGIATKVVSERLGHATTALTTDTYQHVVAGMDEEAAVKAGSALREARARLTSG